MHNVVDWSASQQGWHMWQERLEMIKRDKEAEDLRECTFRPAINSRSDRLMADRSEVLKVGVGGRCQVDGCAYHTRCPYTFEWRIRNLGGLAQPLSCMSPDRMTGSETIS